MSADHSSDPKTVTPAMIAAADRWVAEVLARPPSWQRALRMLLDGESLTAVEATKKYGEWNFRQTVRELKARGLKLSARPEIEFDAIMFWPQVSWRYGLRPESRALAVELLGDAGAET